jgi:hypothetical protein
MSRVLALIALLAPREWGRAMRAELAALDDPRARRRFVRGCAVAVLTRPALWGRVAAVVLVAALLFTRPGGHALFIAAVALASCVVALREDGFGVAAVGALAWWAGLLLSATVRAHPGWALLVVAACACVGARRAGALAALGTALATCLAVFVVAVGTYAALPRLAPAVAPANAADPLLENQIESTDPYVGELLLAALLGLALAAASATGDRRRLPG